MVNVLSWPALQLSLARAFTIMPDRFFAQDSWLTRTFDREALLYRNVLRIRAWKELLPDAAPFVGGFPKKCLESHQPAYLRQFTRETRRSELAHWAMFACLPIFFLWNPPWACVVIAVYAAASNLPCILTQRYNRATIERLLTQENNSISKADPTELPAD